MKRRVSEGVDFSVVSSRRTQGLAVGNTNILALADSTIKVRNVKNTELSFQEKCV